MTGPRLLDNVDALAALVPDGARVGVPKDTTGVPMALTRALIRRRVGGLHVITLPQSGVQTDLLIGAGCVATVETAGVTLSEHGLAPCFVRAVKAGAIRLMDSTCPAIYAAYQAGGKGQPFVPIRGIIGSDLVRYRPDYKVIDNPLQAGDPILIVPAIRPQVALLHAAMADRAGNVWIGAERDGVVLAQAAETALVTVEEIVDEDLLADPVRRPGTLPSIYVGGLAVARNGAWPLGLPNGYPADGAHLALYARMAASEEGLQRYLSEHVLARAEAAE